MARSFNGLRGDFEAVFVTGRNDSKRRALERLAQTCRFPMRVTGFIEHPEHWLERADVVISKPGGVSVSEIMAMSKPMLILGSDSFLEDVQVRRLQEMRVPMRHCSIDELNAEIEALMRSPEELRGLAGHASPSFHPEAALAVSNHLLQTVRTASTLVMR